MTYFIPERRTEFFAVLEQTRNRAIEEAKRISAANNIPMKVERLTHGHLNLTDPKILNAVQTFTLKSNTAVFFAGLFNNDAALRNIEWFQGAGVSFIGDWFVRDVFFFEEKNGAYRGNLRKFEFRGNETFRHDAVPTTGAPTDFDAWFIAWTVLPQTLSRSVITQT